MEDLAMEGPIFADPPPIWMQNVLGFFGNRNHHAADFMPSRNC
jgi:hypothetical protein